MTTDLGLGDVLRAWRALDARTDDERRAIARLLGFELREAEPAEEPRPPAPRPPPEPEDREADHAPPPPSPPAPGGEASPIELVPFTDVHVNPPDLGAERLAPPVAAAAPVLDPLFGPGWSRSIASTLCARPAQVGAIDIERTAERVALRVPIRQLPRRSRMVSAAEVTVVIDARGTLAWFRADAEQLIARLDAVTRAPVARVETDGAPVLAIATGAPGSPARRRGAPEDEPECDCIHVGTRGRVIALTDLGLGSPWTRGDPARARAWLELAIELRQRGASLVIVTPVPRERIPSRLARSATCVYWDRATRPGFVHRLIKERA